MAKSGLVLDILDIDKFIKVNSIREVTNPVFLDRNMPTRDGVLSYEIFGTSQEERRNRFGYINLYLHYMHPLAATKLGGYDRTLSKLLYSQSAYILKDGVLIEDYENGRSGPEFLYEIWGKVKVRDKDTITTKELEKFFKQDRDKLFVTKWIVIPAFYRDLNTHDDGSGLKKSSSTLNSMYSSIISYVQTLNTYSDISHYARLTQSRVQTLLCDLYEKLMVETVKGKPSKFGMLKRSLQAKNVNYSSRLVLSSPILQKASYEDVQVKFGTATVPLAYTITSFLPFVVYQTKQFFDRNFIQGGKVPVYNKTTKKIEYTSFKSSYDETEITKMINQYLNDPSSRFNPMPTPPDTNGETHQMVVVGRFGKENTTISRGATLTDILFICTVEAVKDKHIFVTRYPLDNYNGQWPGRINVASTIKTTPALIGNTYYPFYPVCEGDPMNAFVDTLQFSNTMIAKMGADYDGDCVSIRGVFSKEANDECEKRINSVAYILDVEGKFMRGIDKDFTLCLYNLTRTYDNNISFLKDANKTTPKYTI